MTMQHDALRRRLLLVAAGLPALAAGGCTTTLTRPSASSTDKRRQIDAAVDSTLSRLYSEVRGSRELVGKAHGVLVFPAILAAGLVLGGEYGEGALRVRGRNEGYYRTTSASFGWQAGAQSKALVMLFMTQDALDKFRKADGWTAGIDASVALLTIGANGEIDTNTIRAPVTIFALTNAGLMANLTIEGTKVSRLAV